MKVLVVDDDALIRDSLKILLELEEDFQVVGVASNGQEAFEICKKKQPDIVLMDIRMPIMDGVLGTKRIKEHFPEVKVAILTTFRDDEYIKEAVKNGAEGYILKNQSSDSMIESLRTIQKGNSVFEKEVASTLSAMLQNNYSKKRPEEYQITNREFEVLQLLGRGFSNKEIAEELYLSEGTVRNYVTRLIEKIEVRDRTQLAIFYLKNFSK